MDAQTVHAQATVGAQNGASVRLVRKITWGRPPGSSATHCRSQRSSDRLRDLVARSLAMWWTGQRASSRRRRAARSAWLVVVKDRAGAASKNSNPSAHRRDPHSIVWSFDDDSKVLGEESWSQPSTSRLEKLDYADVPPRSRSTSPRARRM